MKNTPVQAQTAFLSGNEALAQGAFEAGLRVACAYPGTPSTEILEYLSQFQELDCQWSTNEKVAFEVAFSSAIAGVRSLFASKHVGLNVAMDAFMTSAYVGTSAGFVIISCDDPGLHSSQNEQDNRLFAKAAKVPLLEPASPCEAKEFIRRAFTISEQFDTPVMLRSTTRISHTKENVRMGMRAVFAPKPFAVNIEKYVMVPRNAYKRHIELEKKLVSLRRYSNSTPLNTVELKNKKIGFVTSSVSYLYAKEMYPDASFLKLGFSYPVPDKLIQKFARAVKELYVVEELEPFLEEELKVLGIRCHAKHPSLRIGELRPELIPYIVKGKARPLEPPAARKPTLCPGCMHRPVFTVLKKLKTVVTGDIGCYTLGATPPLLSLHTCLCMGAAISFFEGFGRAGVTNRVGVIGDSTFVHAGIPALINLAYNRARGVIIILDNGTTAMTGNQPHPAVGITIKGEATVGLNLENLCKSCGTDFVCVVDPYNIKELHDLIKARIAARALSVIIARAPCRLIDRSKHPAPCYDRDKCTQCYLCLGIDCPALRKTGGGLIAINDALCVGCNLCVDVCNFQALVRYEKT